MRTLIAFAQPRPVVGLVVIWLVIALLSAVAEGGQPDLRRLAMLWVVWLGLNVFATIHNDLCDIDLDRLSKPDKPLVRGAADISVARRLAWGGAAAGLLGAGLLGAASFVASFGLLGLAYWHDRGAKRGPWSFAPSLLSAGLIPLWVWASYGKLVNGERWATASGLSVLLFAGIYLLTTLWDYSETAGTSDIAHRIGLRGSLVLAWVLLATGWLVVTASIFLVAFPRDYFVKWAAAADGGAIVIAILVELLTSRIQVASLIAGVGSTALLIGWLAAMF